MYELSLHLLLSSHFLVSAIFHIIQVADEDKEWCQTQKHLRDSLRVIDCQLDFEPLTDEPNVQPIFNISNGPASP